VVGVVVVAAEIASGGGEIIKAGNLHADESAGFYPSRQADGASSCLSQDERGIVISLVAGYSNKNVARHFSR
jgi:FixJ family two-component response regulator